MARKRLLTILAAVITATGLQVGAATAMTVEGDELGVDAEVSATEDGVSAQADEVEAEASEDGATAELGDQEVSTEELEEADGDGGDGDDGDEVEEVADAVTDAAAGEESEDEPEGSDDDGAKRSGSESGGVTAAGGAEGVSGRRDSGYQRPEAMDPGRARQLLASSYAPGYDRGSGDARPSFELPEDGIDDPRVAGPSTSETLTPEWESADPEAPEPRSDAELAAVPDAGSDGDAVPSALKLVAALLVAGTGTVWHLTRRELQGAGTPA